MVDKIISESSCKSPTVWIVIEHNEKPDASWYTQIFRTPESLQKKLDTNGGDKLTIIEARIVKAHDLVLGPRSYEAEEIVLPAPVEAKFAGD